jgi:hypothetical protein
MNFRSLQTNCKNQKTWNDLHVQSVKMMSIEIKRELSVIRYNNNPLHIR